MNRQEREELAARFEKVADDLKVFCEENGLEETEVDMNEAFDNRGTFTNLCNTPACHGGWIAILYGPKEHHFHGDYADEFYLAGADILAKKLGFKCSQELLDWAAKHPQYWGEEGGFMFDCGSSFGQEFDNFPLSVIYEHYYKVAERLRAKDQ